MLNPQLEQELREDFAKVGDHIQPSDGLTERLLRLDFRPKGRARLVVPLFVCSAAVLALGGVLLATNVGGHQPVAASVLASEFNVFNRPTSSSDTLPSEWPLARNLLSRKGEPTATRLLASNPGYGVEKVYAATYPNTICLFIQATNGGAGSCDTPSDLESHHAMIEWTGGSSGPQFAAGLVANDVTGVTIDGVAAPVLANNFFLAPIASANPPLNVTITLSDGPSITEALGLGVPTNESNDRGSHG